LIATMTRLAHHGAHGGHGGTALPIDSNASAAFAHPTKPHSATARQSAMLADKSREDMIMALRVSRWMSAALALAAAASLAATAPAAAEEYPVRPVRIVVGFTAGSSGDVAARVLAQQLSARFGQQFVIENRTGAGSNIATNYVAHAPKDGYTLLQATVANTLAAATMSNPTFDVVKDFEPVALYTRLPNIVAVHPSTGATNIRELIALARARPGQLSFGSAGVGSGSHFTGELFNVMAGVRLLHVPYGGSAQVMSDLLSGRVQVMFSPAATVLPQVNEGKLTALASTGLHRASAAPDLPTVSESGVPGFDTSSWFGLLAPAGVPRDVIERLAHAINEAATSPGVIAALRPLGYEMEAGSPEAFAAFIRADLEKWSRVVAATGLKR
jgi:tripartite-type tricarboxylate transporter receptor subunit TctC